MKNWITYITGIVILLVLVSHQGYSQTDVKMKVTEQGKTDIQVQVFPNPSNGEFKLKLESGLEGAVSAKIYDMTGKLVKDLSDQLAKEDQVISGDIKLQDTATGIHFLRIQIGRTSVTKKIIIR